MILAKEPVGNLRARLGREKKRRGGRIKGDREIMVKLRLNEAPGSLLAIKGMWGRQHECNRIEKSLKSLEWEGRELGVGLEGNEEKNTRNRIEYSEKGTLKMRGGGGYRDFQVKRSG